MGSSTLPTEALSVEQFFLSHHCVHMCVHVCTLSFISGTIRDSPLTCVFPAPPLESAISPGALDPCPHGLIAPQCPVPSTPPSEGSGASVTLGSERLRPSPFHPLRAVGFLEWM